MAWWQRENFEGAEIMTSKERIQNALKFKPVDYIPVSTDKEPMGAALIGVKYNRDYYLRPEIMAKAQMAIWEKVRDDAVNLRATPALQEGLGCILLWPENDHIQFGKAIIKTREDAEKLEIPDPNKSELMAALLEAVRILRKWAGNEIFVEVGSHGIFNTASRLMGVEKMIESTIRDRELLDIVCNKIVDADIRLAGALKEAGADLRGAGDAMCSPAVLSPKMFASIAVPHIRRQMKGYRDAGLIAQYHPCGGEYPIIDQMKDLGADTVSFSELVDLDVAQKIFYRRIAVGGGIDPINTLYLGTPESVDSDTKEVIGKLKHKSGVIIRPGCGLSTNIPVKNLAALTRAVRKYSELAGQKLKGIA